MKRTHPILLAAILLFGLALAQQTPAGTNISNQASASYIDSAGQPRTTTSNQVITVVQQVYSFTITPDGTQAAPGQTRSALAGAPVYFTYTVSNTGNGTDTINLTTVQDTGDNFDLSSTAIYLDANCNGTLDPGETAPITSVTLTRQGTPGASACVIVAGTIPASATNGQFGNLNLSGTSAGNPSVTDVNNWARAIATTAAALTATKSASPAGSVNPGSAITYTISGSNVGGSAASGVSVSGLTGSGILIRDTIPSGLVVSTMPTGSAGAGTVQMVFSTDGTTWAPLASGNLPLTGNGTIAVGMFISGSGAFFPQTASYTFSFQATVPAASPAGTTYLNSASVLFNDGTANQSVTSNTTTNTVGFAYNVAVGPWGYPESGASGNYTVGSYTVTRSGDQQTIASVNSGTTVTFRHTLKNTGNTADSFTLSFSGAPSGWACSLVAADLTTPISGPVGPVAAGSTFDFALQCQVPATYTSSTAATITLTATSTNDPSKQDITTDVVSAVADGFRFDIYGGLTAPYTVAKSPDTIQLTSDDSVTVRPPIPSTSANPGASVTYRLRIDNLNPNNQADNYLLLVQPALNFAQVDNVLFYADANDDGIPDGPPITNTGLVNYGATFRYLAVVTLKSTAAPVSVGFNFAAQSTASSTEGLDWVYAQINVNLVAQISLEPPRSGTITTPGTLTYTHTLVNNSNQSGLCSISGDGGSFGWAYQYSLDGSTWAASLSGVSVAANGGSQTLYVRVLAPAGQPIGRTDVNTLTASCTIASASVTATASETTTVVGGDLRLTKSAVSYVGSSTTVRDANAAVALPGDQILYTVVAQNIGTGNLTQVVVSDPLPSYTSFVSASASISGFSGTVLYSTDGSTWSTTAPTALASGQTLYVAVDTNGDNTITSADTLPPGATITLSFRVQVQ